MLLLPHTVRMRYIVKTDAFLNRQGVPFASLVPVKMAMLYRSCHRMSFRRRLDLQGPCRSPGIAEMEHGYQMLAVYKARLYLTQGNLAAAEHTLSTLEGGSEEVSITSVLLFEWCS